MSAIKDETGKVYGKWQVLGRDPDKLKAKEAFWLCRCTCGVTKSVVGRTLRNKESTGCRKCKDPIHGWTGTPLYKTVSGVLTRCYNTKASHYRLYGGRGIGVYSPWRTNLGEFCNYIQTALGPKPSPEYSLDRIDNNKDYEPGNLRWATPRQQNENKRKASKLPLGITNHEDFFMVRYRSHYIGRSKDLNEAIKMREMHIHLFEDASNV